MRIKNYLIEKLNTIEIDFSKMSITDFIEYQFSLNSVLTRDYLRRICKQVLLSDPATVDRKVRLMVEAGKIKRKDFNKNYIVSYERV